MGSGIMHTAAQLFQLLINNDFFLSNNWRSEPSVFTATLGNSLDALNQIK